MMHPDQMYQLRQLRNDELLMKAQQAQTTHELVHNRSLLENDNGRTTMLKLTIRYARYVLSSLAAVGFAMN
jgi:hypothetical protein